MTRNFNEEKQAAARAAVKEIQSRQIIGLGTGSSAFYALQEIGAMISQGLNIQAVATSNHTQQLAEKLHIPLVDINSVHSIDITIDGADEFSPDLTLIKGGGGALLREKIVAAMSKAVIIITDSSKRVDILGKFKVPLAVVPFATNYVLSQLLKSNGQGAIRQTAGSPFLTDEGNYVVDADFGLISDPARLAEELNAIEGVVAHGLFIKLATKVIMGNGNTTVTFDRS